MGAKTVGEVIANLFRKPPLKRYEVRITLTAYPEARNMAEAKIAALEDILNGEARYDDATTTIRELEEGQA